MASLLFVSDHRTARLAVTGIGSNKRKRCEQPTCSLQSLHCRDALRVAYDHFQTLPDDLIVYILEFCIDDTLRAAAQVATRWAQCCKLSWYRKSQALLISAANPRLVVLRAQYEMRQMKTFLQETPFPWTYRTKRHTKQSTLARRTVGRISRPDFQLSLRTADSTRFKLSR